MECHPIAHIQTDFGSKFGIPRQAGLVPELVGRIVFEPEYRSPEALRGLDGYSHLWLIWQFNTTTWSPTVRPPRLGGNVRMGVFATRSPFRPNPIGLSSVQISHIELHTPDGPVIYVLGADLMDGTPILDIKPYLPFTDAHPNASEGFTAQTQFQPSLQVNIPEQVQAQYKFTTQQWEALRQVLSQDPRPHYQDDDARIYGMEFGGEEIHFQVVAEVLTVMPKEA